MKDSHISLIALIVAVFFSGLYLRGEAARKKEIKRELDLIKEKQTEIIDRVNEINRVTAERDQMYLDQIDSARSYIDLLNVKDSLTSAKIAGFGVNIKLLQEGLDESLSSLSGSQRLTVVSPVVESPSSEQ